MELESFKKAQGRIALYRLGDTWTFELTEKMYFYIIKNAFTLSACHFHVSFFEKMLMFGGQKIYTESGNGDRIAEYMVHVWNEIDMFA